MKIATKDDPRLLNVGELAKALGVNRSYITAMKRYGFSMPLGRSTIARALEWLDRNAEHLDEVSVTSDKEHDGQDEIEGS